MKTVDEYFIVIFHCLLLCKYKNYPPKAEKVSEYLQIDN